MASAQLYWGRTAALLLRLLYSAFPMIPWHFVYVDDFAWILPKQEDGLLAMSILAFLLAVGLPLSWKKTELGTVVKWLGFIIHINEARVLIPGDKLHLLDTLLAKIENGDAHSELDVQKLVGRLQWASTAWPLTRPWLQPFWAWMTQIKGKGRPGLLLKHIAKVLRRIYTLEVRNWSPFEEAGSWYGATDAGADDESAAVGGWFSAEDNPDKQSVHWFMEKISRENHPWAYDKATPQQRISSLELYGSICLVKLILQQDISSTPIIPIFTDNQGNALALLANRSKKWPNAAFIMDLALTLFLADAQVRPQFIKREYNEWADQLTHLDTSGFTADKRLQVPHTSTWPAFPTLMVSVSSNSGGSSGSSAPKLQD